LRVSQGISAFPPLRINIRPTSERVRLSTKTARPVQNRIVEGRQKLGPPSLPADKELGGGEILKVLVVCNHLDRVNRALKV
jgi:hypothetical protein